MSQPPQDLLLKSADVNTDGFVDIHEFTVMIMIMIMMMIIIMIMIVICMITSSSSSSSSSSSRSGSTASSAPALLKGKRTIVLLLEGLLTEVACSVPPDWSTPVFVRLGLGCACLCLRLLSRECLGHHRKGPPGIGNIYYVLNVG